MMATVPHVTSGLGLRKFQADGFLSDWVYILLSSRNRCFDYDVSFRCMFNIFLILHTWSSKMWFFIATLNKCYVITDSSRAHWISSCLRDNFFGTNVKSRRRQQRHKRRNFRQMCLLSDKSLECEGSTSVSIKFNSINPYPANVENRVSY